MISYVCIEDSTIVEMADIVAFEIAEGSRTQTALYSKDLSSLNSVVSTSTLETCSCVQSEPDSREANLKMWIDCLQLQSFSFHFQLYNLRQ